MSIEKLIHDIRFTAEAARLQQNPSPKPLANGGSALVMDEMHGLATIRVSVDNRMPRVRHASFVPVQKS